MRTLATRPGNNDRPSIVTIAKAMESSGKPKTISYQTDKPNRARKSSNGNMVGMFKLADEAQMGSLNNLMSYGDIKPKSSEENMDLTDFDYDGKLKKQLIKQPLP